jgi:hypothetical protein
MNSISLSTKPENPVRSFVFSSIPLPQINHFLSLHCHSCEWNVFCFAVFFRLQRCSGESHESLSADVADRYPVDCDSLHFSARTAVEDTSAITGILKAWAIEA